METKQKSRIRINVSPVAFVAVPAQIYKELEDALMGACYSQYGERQFSVTMENVGELKFDDVPTNVAEFIGEVYQQALKRKAVEINFYMED